MIVVFVLNSSGEPFLFPKHTVIKSTFVLLICLKFLAFIHFPEGVAVREKFSLLQFSQFFGKLQ